MGIKAQLSAMFADDTPRPCALVAGPAGGGRTEHYRITIRAGPSHLAYPRRTCLVNLNVALLLLVLAGGIGGTAAVQAALRRSDGRRRGQGAVFRLDG
ncbi:hypothetical protein EEB14_53240 [Rhodococcus sp. WS4]|nr:hypothetical protein EEB14_53240 [Rhodococcus sp. WS4]